MMDVPLFPIQDLMPISTRKGKNIALFLAVDCRVFSTKKCFEDTRKAFWIIHNDDNYSRSNSYLPDIRETD
jgi:hypothetical protein